MGIRKKSGSVKTAFDSAIDAPSGSSLRAARTSELRSPITVTASCSRVSENVASVDDNNCRPKSERHKRNDPLGLIAREPQAHLSLG